MSYFVVSNIPKCYRSADLRKHFKTFTEKGHFSCFHFKHRPEERPVAEQPIAGSSETPQPQVLRKLCSKNFWREILANILTGILTVLAFRFGDYGLMQLALKRLLIYLVIQKLSRHFAAWSD